MTVASNPEHALHVPNDTVPLPRASQSVWSLSSDTCRGTSPVPSARTDERLAVIAVERRGPHRRRLAYRVSCGDPMGSPPTRRHTATRWCSTRQRTATPAKCASLHCRGVHAPLRAGPQSTLLTTVNNPPPKRARTCIIRLAPCSARPMWMTTQSRFAFSKTRAGLDRRQSGRNSQGMRHAWDSRTRRASGGTPHESCRLNEAQRVQRVAIPPCAKQKRWLNEQ
jgi:hypothetical protein